MKHGIRAGLESSAAPKMALSTGWSTVAAMREGSRIQPTCAALRYVTSAGGGSEGSVLLLLLLLLFFFFLLFFLWESMDKCAEC